MASNNPLVSICIPTYNSGDFLRECLDSIVAQTYDNIEVLIGDDASHDNTVALVNTYVKDYNFTLTVNKRNRGPGATSNNLVSMAKGDYIAVYHSDDVYERTIVEESVKVLNQDKTIGLVGTMGIAIDEQGNRLFRFKLHDDIKKMGKETYDFDDTMLAILKNGGPDIFLVTPTVMARKDVYDDVGMYDTGSYKSAYDYEMWLRMATKYHVAVIDKALINYRFHKNQVSEAQIRQNIDVQNIVWVIRDYQHRITSRKIKNYCQNTLDKWFFRTAKRQNYLRDFQKSNTILAFVSSKKYMILKFILQGFNALKIPLKRGRRAVNRQ